MRDERWETDTLFLVFEEDLCFAEIDDPEPVMVKALSLQEVVGEMPDEEADQPWVPLDASNTVTGPGLHMKDKQCSRPPLLYSECQCVDIHIACVFPGCFMECTGVYS